MKIIDAHIHFSRQPGFEETARRAGHVNSVEHLKSEFDRLGIVAAVAMGTVPYGTPGAFSLPKVVNLGGDFAPAGGSQPPFIRYAAGIDSSSLTAENCRESAALFRPLLGAPDCVALKLYAGYNWHYPDDPLHHPFFELAEEYDLPVVIHTGETAHARGLLKYSHPLAVDDVAVNFPRVRFVMAHFGNPWTADAAAVAAKNPNVYIDLSGLAAGDFKPGWFLDHYRGYLEHLRTWIVYLSDYSRFLYGSDWPLVSLESYIEVVKSIVDEEHWPAVFYENALRVFPKLGGEAGEPNCGG